MTKGRRLDSHQHGPVYETGAFLFRATSAKQSGCPGGIEPAASTFTGPCANHYTTDTIRQRIVPAGFEPALFPMSRGRPAAGRRDRRKPRPGFEPGTPRSKRGMIILFTIGATAAGKGVEPSSPR